MATMDIEIYHINDIDSLEQECFLSAVEHSKKLSYHRQIDQERFLKARIALRQGLALRQNVSPENVDIIIDQYGKPETNGIYFNISHSGDYIALVFSDKSAVGIDIEHNDANMDIEGILLPLLNNTECLAVKAIENIDERKLFLYKLWSRREALIKADGRGFLVEDAFKVNCLKEKVNFDKRVFELQSPEAPTGYSLAVCAELFNE